MKKVALLIEDLFDEQELIYPFHRLREDFEVVLIGGEADKLYKSKSGFGLKSDIASADARAEDYVGVYIPGGFSPDYMRRTEATVDFVRAMDQAKKPIAAICHGPWMLASAVDLQGVEVTSFYSIKDDLIHAGAQWLDQAVVQSGHYITARNPKDLAQHVQAFVAALK